jgi:hypothetical protein
MKEQSTKFKAQSTTLLASFPQPHRFLNKIITTRAAQFLNIALFNGKQATGVWPVFVNTTKTGTVRLPLQEGTLEHQFATSATAITFSTPQRQGIDGVLFAEVSYYKAPNFALGLAGPKLCVCNLAGANALTESFFKRALLSSGTLAWCSHWRVSGLTHE